MITETRLIYFSHEALVEAVRLYSSGTARRPALGAVRRVWLKSIAPPIVVAEIESNESGSVRQLEFSHAEVAAFLILLCRREKIPLPKHSDKLLRVDAGSLCLVISRRAISITPSTTQTPLPSDLSPEDTSA
ncbi:Phage protein [Azospirillaceae bacterium]